MNFYPSAPLLAKAYWEIIDKWQWKTFTVLYEDDESLLRLSELIITAKNEGIVVTVEQLDREGSGSYRYFSCFLYLFWLNHDSLQGFLIYFFLVKKQTFLGTSDNKK